MTSVVRVEALAPRKLLDTFLLKQQEQVAASRDAAQQQTVARLHAAARRRIQVARDLELNTEPVAALTLYREAAVLLIAALRRGTRSQDTAELKSPVEAWTAWDEISEAHLAPPPSLATARPWLANADPSAVDALSTDEQVSVAASAGEAVTWLASRIEPRSVQEIQVTRRVRIVGAGVFVAFLLYELVTSVFGPRNIARGKPAVASSYYPGTAPDASGINNGQIEAKFGVHTNHQDNPWVQIDLGAIVSIKEVRVYNRGDGIPMDAIPITLQVSEDGRVFTDVERRDSPFTREDPWIAKVGGRRGRFVRVIQQRNGYIALSEIEVY